MHFWGFYSHLRFCFFIKIWPEIIERRLKKSLDIKLSWKFLKHAWLNFIKRQKKHLTVVWLWSVVVHVCWRQSQIENLLSMQEGQKFWAVVLPGGWVVVSTAMAVPFLSKLQNSLQRLSSTAVQADFHQTLAELHHLPPANHEKGV